MPSSRLAVRRLEDRTVPATFSYRPATQTLMVNGANNDQLEIRHAGPDAPVGYLSVTEVGSGEVVFDSLDAARPVRSVFVNFSRVANGSLLVGPAVRLPGNLDLLGARATQSLTLLGKVGGNLNYTDTSGAADTAVLDGNAQVGGSLSLKLSEGTNTVQLKTGTIGGNLLVGGRHGPDTVELMEAGPVTVGGFATFALGNGANTLTGKAANRLTTGRDFFYTGLAGADTINFQAGGADLTVGGLARITQGGPFHAGNNIAYFDNVVVGGTMSFIGGVGGDDIEFYGGLTLGGDFTASLGDGYNYLDFNFASAATNTIGGKVSYTGGVNLDVIYVDGTTIGKSAVFDLKDAIGLPTDPTDPTYNKQGVRLGQYVPTGNRIFGHFGIKATGTGINFIDVARTAVFNGLTIELGAGVDVVRVNDSNIQGQSKFNLGAGDDALRLELDDEDAFGVLLDGPSSFGGPVTVLGGLGDDNFLISTDSDATSVVRFGGRLTLDGGPGTDNLGVGAETVFLGGPAPTAF
jgi:hypothetical protein